MPGSDFSGDGVDDLAIGLDEDVGGHEDAGAVNVLAGSAGGLTVAGAQIWHQDSPGVPGAPAFLDGFGSALAAGDFDGDGFDDLAIGVPEEDVGGASDAGVVNVLFGSAAGLTAAGSQIWHQDSAGVPGAAENFDRFGNVLA
jgi:hypothetical protein